jgi:hypothetical protein
MAALPKHERYLDRYLPGDTYWGLGVENETYLELKGRVWACAEFIKHHQRRERYSVDYWKLYKDNIVERTINEWISTLPEMELTQVRLPLLMNGHSFTKTDTNLESQTSYSKIPKPNPKYNGKSLLESLEPSNRAVFVDGRDVWWTFDGDTIEFMTQNYYCAKMEDVLDELAAYKARWLAAVQHGLGKLEDKNAVYKRTVGFPEKNYGLAIFLTNRENVAIFNNGTYHINITLPTYLDKDAEIADMVGFTQRHCAVARLFQWLSPLLIAKFGSPDIFALLTKKRQSSYPIGSQRLCSSRYISVGTFDTSKMPRGKILTEPYVRQPERWYEKVYDNPECAYSVLPALGLDINFNKHGNHGLELRIFDWFPESMLPDLMRLLIWMCDEALFTDSVIDARTDSSWNDFTARCIWHGASVILTPAEAEYFGRIFQCKFHAGMEVLTMYDTIWKTWRDRWNWSVGTCTSKMIRRPLDIPRPRPPVRLPSVPLRHIPSTAAPTNLTQPSVPIVHTAKKSCTGWRSIFCR